MAISILAKAGYVVDDPLRLVNTEGDGRTYPDSSYYVTPAFTNLIANGGFETNTNGWSVGGATNTLTRSTTRSKFGVASALLTVGSDANTNIASTNTTLTAAPYTFSIWVWIPTSYTGTALRLSQENYTNAVGPVNVSADLTKRDQWQQLFLTFTPDVGDLTGSFVIRYAGASTGDTVYIDGAQITQSLVPLPYAHTDGGSVAKTAGSVQPPNWVIDRTQGGIAFRVRMGWPNTATPYGGTGSPRVANFAFDAGNAIQCYYRETDSKWACNRVSTGGGTAGSAISGIDTFAKDDIRTVIFAWDSGNVKVRVGNNAFISVPNTQIPVGNPSTFYLGGNNGVSLTVLHGLLLWGVFFKGTASDSDAATLVAMPDSGIDGTMMPSNIGVSGFTDFSEGVVNYYPFDPDGVMFNRWEALVA